MAFNPQRLRLRTDSPANRIDLDTYERQRIEFTKQQVGLLAQQIQRDPKIANTAAHYQKVHLAASMKEVAIRTSILAAFGLYLIYISRQVSFPVVLDNVTYRNDTLNLHQRIPEFLCTNEFTRVLDQIPNIWGLAAFILVIWIFKQYIKVKSIETRLSTLEQFTKIVVDNLFPITVIIVSVFATLFVFSSNVVGEDGESHRCVNLPAQNISHFIFPSIQDLYTGIFALTLKHLLYHPRWMPLIFNHSWIFFGLIASLYATYLQLHSLAYSLQRNHWLATMIMGSIVAFNQSIGWHGVDAGEFLVICFVFTRAVANGARFLMLARAQRRAEAISKTHAYAGDVAPIEDDGDHVALDSDHE